jgi:hypothetical protein
MKTAQDVYRQLAFLLGKPDAARRPNSEAMMNRISLDDATTPQEIERYIGFENPLKPP